MRWFGGPAAMAVARPRALLGARDEGREVDRLAWPIIADGIFQTALDLTNLALIGRLGTEALSGVGAATQLIQLGVAALAAVSVGGMVVVAQGAVYLRLAALAFPALGVMTVGAALMRGSGDSRTPMSVTGLTNLIN